MADGSHIEWTDATWNPVTGCSVVSPGCTNCYAMKLAGGRLAHHPSRAGLTEPSKAVPVWNGQVRLNAEWLTQPLAWKRPRRIFVCAHGDLFHEAVPDAWIDQVFAVMARVQHIAFLANAVPHAFQVLTKRATRMRAYVEGLAEERWVEVAPGNVVKIPPALPNVWLGVSVEDQSRADERIPELLATPAAKRFISAEPLLGPIDLQRTGRNEFGLQGNTLKWPGFSGPTRSFGPRLDWVIVGGESGRDARPMHTDWARKIRDDCAGTGVPFFFKQWGAWLPAGDLEDGGERFIQVGKRAAGALLDGVEHRAFPA